MRSYFDAHCDTMSKIYKNGVGLDGDTLMVNVKNLEGYKNAVQVFALFNGGTMNKAEMLRCLSIFKGECQRLSHAVRICTSASQIDENTSPLSAILAIEGLGNQPDFTPDDIKDFYDTGVRFMGLCWNNDNSLGGGCDGNGGLTELGRQTLREMEKYKIILDVSHLSDRSFYECFEHYSLPICATHSLSRSVYAHRRNLTDEQFTLLARRGGVCGVNFYPPFLTGARANIDSVIAHVEHLLSLGGDESVGIGSDFDGMSTVASGLENSGCLYRLADRLITLNYSEETVDKIMYQNFKNLFKRFDL